VEWVEAREFEKFAEFPSNKFDAYQKKSGMLLPTCLSWWQMFAKKCTLRKAGYVNANVQMINNFDKDMLRHASVIEGVTCSNASLDKVRRGKIQTNEWTKVLYSVD
jgi:hypothetical protein